MSRVENLFVTKLYRAELAGSGPRRLLRDLDHACRTIAEDDAAGRQWAKEHNYPGYTSYASLDDLPERDPAFAELAAALEPHIAAFARESEFDLGRHRLVLDSVWINVLDPEGAHPSHIHPQSVVSGTLYVAVPKGASAIRFEDPRLPMMMAAPPRKARARREHRAFVTAEPRAGTLLLWESWLRHDVPPNASREQRISISFNYRLQ